MATQESSVRMNLKELFAIEADRRAEEAVAAERARAEAEARRERERLERERHIAEARAEERRLAEEEQRRRDAELEARLSTLRDQLAEVQAEREAMHRRVAELATQPVSPAPRRGVWMASVMAAASMLAAATATWVAWPRPEPMVAELAPTIEEPAPAPAAAELVAPPVVAEAPAPVAAPVEETPGPVVRPGRPPRRDRTSTVVRAEREPADSLGRQLDALSGGDRRDVLSPELLP